MSRLDVNVYLAELNNLKALPKYQQGAITLRYGANISFSYAKPDCYSEPVARGVSNYIHITSN